MAPGVKRESRIAFLLGKPAKTSSILPFVFDQLRGIPATASVHIPKGNETLPGWIFASDLVVQRGLGPEELLAAHGLEEAGVRCCNRVTATIITGDRAKTFDTLRDAGLPVPMTTRAITWSEVLDIAQGHPSVVKAADGTIGRGIAVLLAERGDLPPVAPFAGPFVIQTYVRHDGRDHKIYVSGSSSRRLIKRWKLRDTADRLGVSLAFDGELADLAHRVGAALGLEIFGVDVLYGPNGPEVVDVNPFPGFRGVPDGAHLIAQHLTEIAFEAVGGR